MQYIKILFYTHTSIYNLTYNHDTDYGAQLFDYEYKIKQFGRQNENSILHPRASTNFCPLMKYEIQVTPTTPANYMTIAEILLRIFKV